MNHPNPDSENNAIEQPTIALFHDAVAAFVADDGTRRRFLNLAGSVGKIFKSLLPDAAA